MFVIKDTLNNIDRLWGNSHDDDFIQFLPNELGITKEQMEIYKCTNTVQLDETANYRVTIDTANLKITYEKKTAGFMAGEMEGETEHTIDSVDLAFAAPENDALTQINWPYDIDGKFLGNN